MDTLGGQMIYQIHCEHCGARLDVLQTILLEIVQGPRASYTDDPALLLVCADCKTPFRYRYRPNRGVGVLDESPQNTDRWSATHLRVLAECVDNNCEALVELIAIRPHDTTEAELLAEKKEWILGGVQCKCGNKIVLPE